ncbi:MAG: AAA family ATPase [bacterium]|nr:AAA family ATPase [bacterium]
MRKEVVIVAGANGSGKTTFAKSFSDFYPFEFINADEIAFKLNPQNVDSVKLQAGRIFFSKTDTLLRENENFLVESTLSGKYLLRLIDKIKSKGYFVKLIYIFLENPTICIERIKERVLKGGHHVPTPDVIRRYYRSKQNFWNQYKEKADMWCLVYNSEEFFTEIAIGANENYIINSNELFEKFLEIVKKGEGK